MVRSGRISRLAGSSLTHTKIPVLDNEGRLVRTLSFETPEHTALPLIQAITSTLRGIGEKEYLSYGDNALRTQTVIDTVLVGYYGGRENGIWNRAKSWPGPREGR